MTAARQGDLALVRAEAEAILSGEALGRSHALERLFRFLLACTLEGRSPKEVEIADQVFARSPDSIDQDASIRVHIHRLRRKLEEYYRGPGASRSQRLVIPKADYRLAIERHDQAHRPDPPAPKSTQRGLVLVAVAGLVLVAAALGWWFGSRTTPLDRTLLEVRSSALWRPVLSNSRRVAVVVGDYYIFGERDPLGTVTRLVREFDVNSARDLEQLNRSGTATGDFVDLGFNYLPVGTGNAIRSVTPILLANSGGGVVPSFVVPASQLTPEMIKYTNLVYLGYLSGLGPLRDPTFSNSRFSVGDSYDQIIDRQTGRTYSATTPLDGDGGGPGRDYAIVTSYGGVTANRIVVIAGTRDAGLMQAAEFIARPDALAALARAQGNAPAFEALVEVESLESVGLRARLIAAYPRRAEIDWSARRAQDFPDTAAKPAIGR